MTHSRLVLRRTALKVGAGAAVASLARPAIGQGKTRVLRFVPSSDLFSLDPLYATAYVSVVAGFMVFDQLYGLDASLTPRPQMVEGDEVSDDGLVWRFTLRKDLHFHDSEPVLARDAAASVGRWAQRHPFGVRMKAQLDDLRPIDDRRFEIRLKKPFPQMRFALATVTCHVRPERLAARTNAFSEIKEVTGSGPYVFVKDEWVSGARAVFRRNEHYVPRDEKPSALTGGKLVNVDRVEWLTMPDPPTAAAALQKDEVDWWETPLFDLLPKLHMSVGVVVETINRLGWWANLYFNNRVPPFDNPKLRRALLPAINQSDYMQAVVGDQADLMRTGVGVFTPGSPFETGAGNGDPERAARPQTGKQARERKRLSRRTNRANGAGRSAKPKRIKLGVPADDGKYRAECCVPVNGLGHYESPLEQQGADGTQRLELLLRSMDGVERQQSWDSLSSVRPGAGSGDGGNEGRVVRRAGFSGTEADCRPDAASRIRGSANPASWSVLPTTGTSDCTDWYCPVSRTPYSGTCGRREPRQGRSRDDGEDRPPGGWRLGR